MPFQGFILIGQVVPKLWPFIYQTNDRTRWYVLPYLIAYVFYYNKCPCVNVNLLASKKKSVDVISTEMVKQHSVLYGQIA